jgi:hypothetical protein
VARFDIQTIIRSNEWDDLMDELPSSPAQGEG